ARRGVARDREAGAAEDAAPAGDVAVRALAGAVGGAAHAVEAEPGEVDVVARRALAVGVRLARRAYDELRLAVAVVRVAEEARGRLAVRVRVAEAETRVVAVAGVGVADRLVRAAVERLADAAARERARLARD